MSIRTTDLLMAAGGAVLFYTGLTDAKGNPKSLLQQLLQGKRPAPPSSVPSLSPVAGGGAAAAAGTPGPGTQYCASMFGGPTDPATGSTGYHGDNLNGTMAFAELNMGTAMGSLPYRQKVRITYQGRSVIAEKLDIGLGGAGCGGKTRAIDLWWQTAQALGFNGGLGVVSVEVMH